MTFDYESKIFNKLEYIDNKRPSWHFDVNNHYQRDIFNKRNSSKLNIKIKKKLEKDDQLK